MALTVDQLPAYLRTLDQSSFGSDIDRYHTIDAIKDLLARIESPADQILDKSWIQPMLAVVLKIAIDLRLFEKWHDQGGQPMPLPQLASLTNCDEALLLRLLSDLVAQKVITVSSDGIFHMRPLAAFLGRPDTDSIPAFCFLFDIFPTLANLPSFLASLHYRNPTNGEDNWRAFNREAFFETLARDPVKGANFHACMRLQNLVKPGWYQLYPPDNLFAEYKSDRPLLVDVGGSLGHDLLRFRQLYPTLPPGSLVLEDVPEAIDSLDGDAGKALTPIKHDFFTPQPIKGARAYYMHVVLHDWPDNQATEIIKHIAAAMEPGYSKLLIHESVIDLQNPNWFTMGLDVAMMAVLGSMERDKASWEKLISAAGLKMVKIWTVPGAFESVIEAEL